jgi:antitoxin ChpS
MSKIDIEACWLDSHIKAAMVILMYNNIHWRHLMHTTNLRKVGGSVMLAVPPAFLEQLHLQVGATVGLAVDQGCLVVNPQPRPHYTQAELLAEAEAAGVYPLPVEEREWIDAPPVGRELI